MAVTTLTQNAAKTKFEKAYGLRFRGISATAEFRQGQQEKQWKNENESCTRRDRARTASRGLRRADPGHQQGPRR